LVCIIINNNKKKKSCNVYEQKTLNLALTLNPNPRFYEVKFENYGINVMPDNNKDKRE